MRQLENTHFKTAARIFKFYRKANTLIYEFTLKSRVQVLVTDING